ncbi:MAG TPA: hypothetical protein VJ698_18145 [Noviherbaspirillum sp.]|uniref:hypothetical protein n=1 Tax=Noviherbaspirillum sp. TaxID=1926288 RepID=UPI002B474176|nr:hypothetical protein [Noviherbaspirillum sp.]HJV87395.1 hypothetical protein [Noviherbaspirillum sp.]
MIRRIVVALALATSCTAALPCGHCVEDKVAVVYDHAELLRAEAAHHHVAFCAIEGNLPPGEATQHDLTRAAESAQGVDHGSVRVSIDNPALAFTFDPSRTSVERAVKSMNRKLSSLGVRLEPVRVMERTAELKNVDSAKTSGP